MNAVLLKELRQGVRNRYVLAAYLIFILVLLVATGIMTSLFLNEALKRPQSLFCAGRALFLTVHGIFAGVAMLFIPAYVAMRILRERWGTNLDLMYVTPMPPSHLLIGKLGSAMALTGLFLGGALPFLAMSYFIGGIDVPSIVVSTLLTLMGVALLTLLAMLLAIAPMPRIVRGLLCIGLGGTLVGGLIGWLFATAALCSAGYMSILGDADTCTTFLNVVALAVSVGGLLYVAALAGFRSTNVERMRPFRILATALIAGWGIVVLIQSQFSHFTKLPELWVTLTTVFASFMLVFALSERTGQSANGISPLSLSSAPMARRRWRFLGYPFRTGQRNAMLWAILVLAAGIAFSYAIFKAPSAVVEWCRQCHETHLFPCHMVARERLHIYALNLSGYALTMFALWRYFLRRKIRDNAWLWWVLYIVIGLITINFTSLNVGGVAGVNEMVGYAFAQNRNVLPWLYGWNAVGLLLFAVGFLNLRVKK